MASMLFLCSKPQIQAVSKYYEATALQNASRGALAGILTSFIASVIEVFKNNSSNIPSVDTPSTPPAITPADHRTAVIEAVLDFYKSTLRASLAATVNHPFIFDSFIEPAIEKELPLLAGSIYDALVNIMSRPTDPTIETTPTSVTPMPVPLMPAGWQPY